ncbi:MAG: DUF4173 domain-containing protein [Lachnospiraceae bacterium]|nr:DUF4173 domain-containing protein [Lachnospiraceae bacterium]
MNNQNVIKQETFMTKRMKSQFSFFGIASAVYALFYTFCLYKNASGITHPFFVIGTLCYFFLSMKKLGVPYKKDSLFYMISIVLLGISNCYTDSWPILWMNKLCIFGLLFVLVLHTVYQDEGWTMPKYIVAVLQTIGSAIACLFCPLIDMTSFFAAKKQGKSEQKSYGVYILLGIAISIPVLAVMVMLLCSADVVFRNMVNQIFMIDFSFGNAFRIVFTSVVVFFMSYALLAALCKKSVTEEVTDKRVLEPVIAITVNGLLAVLYVAFSMIQILYLFIGNMQLPEGYTYSSYARQGFFQLLAVCIINLIIVLFCISLFKDNLILKIILTVIGACTFIMILSSALRMLMYIERYNLTFLRIFVLWALAVIFLLMAGVSVYIFYQRFPLFFYSVAVIIVCYIGLSFAHPDYWIAAYNLKPEHIFTEGSYDAYDSERYLMHLSADAAPIILNEDKNPYLNNTAASIEETSFFPYYHKIRKKSEEMNVRNFNFSIFNSKRYVLMNSQYYNASTHD